MSKIHHQAPPKRTPGAIAEQVGVTQRTISTWVEDFASLQKLLDPPGATSENPWGHVQHFDIWPFAQADGDSHYQAPARVGHTPAKTESTNLVLVYPARARVEDGINGQIIHCE
jgi:hypothetical protein